MKTLTVSSLSSIIQDGFYRYYMVETVCVLGRCNYIFYLGSFSTSGIVPEYRTQSVGFKKKNLLVELACNNGLICCNL